MANLACSFLFPPATEFFLWVQWALVLWVFHTCLRRLDMRFTASGSAGSGQCSLLSFYLILPQILSQCHARTWPWDIGGCCNVWSKKKKNKSIAFKADTYVLAIAFKADIYFSYCFQRVQIFSGYCFQSGHICTGYCYQSRHICTGHSYKVTFITTHAGTTDQDLGRDMDIYFWQGAWWRCCLGLTWDCNRLWISLVLAFPGGKWKICGKFVYLWRRIDVVAKLGTSL